MEQLINQVSEKADITREQAQIAITEVSGALKAKLPGFLHGQVDNLLDGGTLNESFKQKLDGMKDDFEDAAKQFSKKAGEFAGDVKKKVDDILK